MRSENSKGRRRRLTSRRKNLHGRRGASALNAVFPRKNHFDLHPWLNSLNSSRTKVETAKASEKKHATDTCVACSGGGLRGRLYGSRFECASAGRVAARAPFGYSGHSGQHLFRTHRHRRNTSKAAPRAVSGKPAGLPARSGSPVVEDLVRLGGVQIWNDHGAAPREARGGPAVPRSDDQGLQTGRREHSQA